MENIESYKKEYIDIFNKYINREGCQPLLEYLTKSDFFVAPASSQFHSAFEGGLCYHSINVFKRFLNMVKNEYGDNFEEKVSMETIAICSLLHDVCKIDTFKIDMRNKKVDGNWVQVPFYTVEDSLPYGHGEKSVYILSGFLRLTREEAFAIRFHMGFSGTEDVRLVSDAFAQFPLAFALHTADMEASVFLEKNAKGTSK